MATAMCPECGSNVEVRGIPKRGQRVRCGDCRTELKVSALKPLDLTWADEYFEEGEQDHDDGD